MHKKGVKCKNAILDYAKLKSQGLHKCKFSFRIYIQSAQILSVFVNIRKRTQSFHLQSYVVEVANFNLGNSIEELLTL